MDDIIIYSRHKQLAISVTCPSHVGIEGNEIVDSLAIATKHIHHKYSLNKIPFIDFIPYIHSTIYFMEDQWSSKTATTKWFITIVPEIPHLPSFLNSSLLRIYIIAFLD